MTAAIAGTEAIRTWDDHCIGIDALAALHGTSKVEGLTEAQALAKLATVGENALTKKVAVHPLCLFAEEMTGFFSLLLWFGSALCFIGYIIQEDKEDKANLYLGIVLALVTFITGCFSFLQTSKSAEMMSQFENFIPAHANVTRGGVLTGKGTGICIRTGDATVIGQIANLASSAEAAPTPLSLEIDRFI
jgi:sodium/potassium-transporting ATPase subunit alpha